MFWIGSISFLLLIPSLWGAAQLDWKEHEAEVLAQAAHDHQPIVAAFLGNKFCPWSEKLVDDVLSVEAFQQKIEEHAILWKVGLDQENSEEQLKLRKKYRVEECPSILLLDPMGNEFARFGYLPEDASEYAARLVQIIADFQEICVAFDQQDKTINAKRWKELYVKAGQLSVPIFQQEIIERGIQVDKKCYFLTEKYAQLLKSHKLKNKEVKAFRQQLLKSDPDNRYGTQFKVAMLEFYKRTAIPKKPCEKVIRPLVDYLARFGKKDRENAWKAEWTIAQYLHTKNAEQKALEYAARAHEKAPAPMKDHIAEIMDTMRSENADGL